MSLGRAIAGMIVGGLQVFGRAFAQAYQEAARGAAKGGAAGAANAAKSAATKARAGMTLEEAQKILNVEPNASYEEIMKNYDHLFKINEKKAGGSFYLQSKVYRAKERLELEHPELFQSASSTSTSESNPEGPKTDASSRQSTDGSDKSDK
eukprot:TRINITY_DN8639_c0_g1_i1.p1 TRINITY_DN8639_c0_g1~~TRINITY_DN8639_c0_g1_i1.p1  ORF type:complete len:169 (+),score=28.35 TRINITY_DN8639_c0_g1_i1:55-507(+)